MRVIRRYLDRKLYDTWDGRYLTLAAIAGLVRNGEEISVIDTVTNRDMTGAVMAHVIYAEEKRNPRLSVEALKTIIRTGRL